MSDCIFCRIAARDVPADIVYEDEGHIAFRDINPAAPLHAVVVPKRHVPTLTDMTDPAEQGRLLAAAIGAARALGIMESGFRVVGNYGPDGGQEVMHVHWHVLGGRIMGWPPG
ncbi:MAG: HIT domain-containing protein [Chthonomonadales bacterium]|nr:HIT domain-containing protein [Chthonomonadales bacterium]